MWKEDLQLSLKHLTNILFLHLAVGDREEAVLWLMFLYINPKIHIEKKQEHQQVANVAWR